MKRIVFLIIACLLVLGLVLPGCAGGGGAAPAPVVYDFENNKVIIGICADAGHTTGDFNHYGIAMAEGEINLAGGINIGGHSFNLTHVLIDTDEATDGTGVTGANALQAAITANNFDILMGSFRTEAVEVYREVAMDAKKIFFDCGAATETLQYSVVTNYTRYKYWFKTTPYNEYFLAQSVLKIVNSVATAERAALGLAAGAQLTAVIIAENLTWAKNQQVPAIAAGLPALNIALLNTYYVGSLPGNAAQTVAALASIYNSGYNPHIIIPIYSGYNGAVYDAALAAYVAANLTCPMSVGINIYEQLKTPWTGVGTNLSSPPPAGPYCKDHVILDSWAEGVVQTSKTAAFLSAFATLTGGEYPLYTAATYDACYVLKACLEDVGYVEAGVGKAKADDIIQWLENPAKAQVTTTGLTTYYPRPGATAAGTPALSNAQKVSLYGVAFPYVMTDWLMPPNTTHDLVYGVGLQTGVGCQWQWDAGANKWKKVGIWPRVMPGGGLIDQYGGWNFAYPGTVSTVIPSYVIDHFAP